MNELIKTYLEWKSQYAKRAAINYRIWLERLVLVCGEKNLEDYNVTDIGNYRMWLERKYSPSTIQLAIIILKNFFQFCKMQNLNCINPKLIRLSRIVIKSHRAVSESEYESIIKEIPSNGFASMRDKLMIHILWDTGVRVSELTDLDITQINHNNLSAVIHTKKNGNKRTIMWSKKIHELLMQYMSLRVSECNQTNSLALFLGWKQGRGWYSRLTTRAVERILKKYVRNAKILEPITPHSFRHGWAVKRRDQNAPLAFIQKGLGHLSPISTFVYEQYKDVDFEMQAKKYLS